MAVEIERKYLVDKQAFNQIVDLSNAEKIKQGYIETVSNTVVRIRLKGDKAFLTIKGENKGIVRLEYEYLIPVVDAESMLANLCAEQSICKTRHYIQYQGRKWEVDVFEGRHTGLILAEIELDDENDQPELPPWVTEDVSHDPRYFNSNLIHQANPNIKD